MSSVEFQKRKKKKRKTLQSHNILDCYKFTLTTLNRKDSSLQEKNLFFFFAIFHE